MWWYAYLFVVHVFAAFGAFVAVGLIDAKLDRCDDLDPHTTR